MTRMSAVFFVSLLLSFSIPAFEQVAPAADVVTAGDLKVTGVIDNSGGGGIKFPDNTTQSSACSGCANGILPITLGGTGGDTASEARANLGVPGLATANNFTAGEQTISTGSASNIGLVVRGAMRQSASLQEWRNSSDIPVASVGNGGVLTISGNLNLPETSATTGIIRSGGYPLIHSYGDSNFFAGRNAGNLTMTGWNNTASGSYALYANTSGSDNTASGDHALYSNTEGGENTASGKYALKYNTTGNDNTASGYHALYSNTTASKNTAVGSLALYTQSYNGGGTTPWDTKNTAVGFMALYSNQPDNTQGILHGVNNTAVGMVALYSNTTGNDNTASGVLALYSNTKGINNTASGVQALFSNTEGYHNTANGFHALRSNTKGVANTASGMNALYSNTEGYGNTANGVGALNNSTGNNNTAIGSNAGYNLKIGDNNIYIGTSAQPPTDTESNTTRIGHGISSVFISGIYERPATNGNAVYVTPDGQLGTLTSSRRYKEDIQEMGDATAGIMKLRPVTFYYKREYANGPRLLQYGLIAEEVAEIYPGLVQYNEKGEPNSVHYQFVNAMLLNEVQKQHRQIEQHEDMISRQSDQIKELQAEIAELKRLASR